MAFYSNQQQQLGGDRSGAEFQVGFVPDETFPTADVVGTPVGLTLAGEITLTGSVTRIETGFASIEGVGLALKYTGWTTQLSYETSGGTLTILAWRPIAGDPTRMTAAASASEVCSYVVRGAK